MQLSIVITVYIIILFGLYIPNLINLVHSNLYLAEVVKPGNFLMYFDSYAIKFHLFLKYSNMYVNFSARIDGGALIILNITSRKKMMKEFQCTEGPFMRVKLYIQFHVEVPIC